MKVGWISLFLLSATAVGCNTVGRQVRTTIERYEVGNYNAAARACYEVSDAEEEMNPKGRVRYLVHCGLAHFHLGNRKQASDYLKQGISEYSGRGRASWLKPGIVDEAYKALDDLEGRGHEDPSPHQLARPSAQVSPPAHVVEPL